MKRMYFCCKRMFMSARMCMTLLKNRDYQISDEFKINTDYEKDYIHSIVYNSIEFGRYRPLGR